MKLLSLRNEGIVSQALWALGNIAHDNAMLRDAILQENAVADIVTLYKAISTKTSLYRHVAWALRNLCGGTVHLLSLLRQTHILQPEPDLQYIKAALPVLASLLECDQTDVHYDTLKALATAASDSVDRIQVCDRITGH